jgi:hypothetical protein
VAESFGLACESAAWETDSDATRRQKSAKIKKDRVVIIFFMVKFFPAGG